MKTVKDVINTYFNAYGPIDILVTNYFENERERFYCGSKEEALKKLEYFLDKEFQSVKFSRPTGSDPYEFPTLKIVMNKAIKHIHYDKIVKEERMNKMKHMDLIAEYCEVLDVRYGRAIWYIDGGYKYADILEEGEGWMSYSCDTREMWEMLCGE